MKRALLIISLLGISIGLSAQKIKKFEHTNSTGNILKYEVLSAIDKTVAVTGRKDKLENVVIPDYVEYGGERWTVIEIAPDAFPGGLKRDNMEHVKLPSTLTKIGKRAFSYCIHLKEVILPEGLKEIEPYAFYNCEKLSTISLPSTLEEVGNRAFGNWIDYHFKGDTPGDYEIKDLPAYINEFNCEKMGISEKSVRAYFAQHPRTLQTVSQAQPQEVNVQPSAQETSPEVVPVPKHPISDVDNLPMASKTDNENAFAVIFANEHYRRETAVEYAQNDGQMFKKYCESLLGLPARNIHYVEDATFNDFQAEFDWLSKVGKAYGKDANIIVYYAGHGIPDEQGNHAYLLPTDGIGNNVNTGYSLNRLYALLSELEAQKITVFLDACFSGSKRGEGMLASARGVAIKTKSESPRGNLVVFSAATSDETAYPFEENGHGLFTYFLLKKLKETSGRCSLGELSDYLTTQVTRHSIVVNSKSQTPSITASPALQNTWRSMKLK